MSRSTVLSAVGIGVAAVLSVAAPASAAPTASAVLVCGRSAVPVDGFGRGQVLHVVGSPTNFVVTRAVLADGTVVFDSPAAADRTTVVCTTTAPAGSRYTFTGFFTPAS